MFCVACVIVWIITFIWYFWYKLKDYMPWSSSGSTIGSISNPAPPSNVRSGSAAGTAATPSPLVAGATAKRPISPIAASTPLVPVAGVGVAKMVTLFKNMTKWMYFDEKANARVTILFILSPDESKISLEIYIGDVKQPAGEELLWMQEDPNTIKMTKSGTDEKDYYFTLKYIDPQTLQATEFQNTPKGPVTESHQIKILS